jgi:hypothetical protein
MGHTRELIDREKLFSIHASRVASPTLHIVDQLGNYPGPVQVVTAALVFEIMCRKFGLHRGTVGEVANNVLDRVGGEYPQIRAAIDCVKHEVE